MRNTPIALTIAAAALLATPALAHQRDRGPAVQDDSNSFWLDYRTDISEAKRELANDLRGATDEEDVRDANEEYRHEVADARRDYAKAMRKRGFSTGTVTVETQ